MGFVFIPVVVALTLASSGSLGSANQVSLTQLGKTLAAAVEVLTVEGATAVRLFRREASERSRFGAIQDDLYAANVRRARIGGISAAVAQTLAGLAVAGVILAGVWLLSRGRVTIGELVAFLLLLEQAYGPAGEVANSLGQMRGTRPAALRYEEALAVSAMAPSVAPGAPVPPGSDVPLLAVRALTVRLAVNRGLDVPWEDPAETVPAPTARSVIEDMSFEVRRGEFIGVVGPSGAGKTTLALTLAGLIQPSEGEVLLAGETLAGPDPRIALVPQPSQFFNESVTYNLRYADPEADAEEIERMARVAQVHDVISALPNGYETILGQSGHRLSGGERQRLSITRALLRRPEVLILDEATGHLDSDSEHRLHAALKTILASRDITLIAITHRLVTVRSADRILLVVDGRLQAEGTHDDLTAESRYRDLLQPMVGQ